MKLVIVNKRFCFACKDLSTESKSLLGFLLGKHNRIPHTEIIRGQAVCYWTTFNPEDESTALLRNVVIIYQVI